MVARGSFVEKEDDMVVRGSFVEKAELLNAVVSSVICAVKGIGRVLLAAPCRCTEGGGMVTTGVIHQAG